jgi:hypothetical protein
MRLSERIEKALQNHDRWEVAESLQLFQMHFVPAKRDEAQQTWIKKQTTVKCNLGLLLQREVGLKEEIAALERSSKLGPLTAEETRRKQSMKSGGIRVENTIKIY